MKRYLMGNSADTLDDTGMYPIVQVEQISREDLVRAKRDDLIIIDLKKGAFYNHERNEWTPLQEFQEYKGLWV